MNSEGLFESKPMIALNNTVSDANRIVDIDVITNKKRFVKNTASNKKWYLFLCTFRIQLS